MLCNIVDKAEINDLVKLIGKGDWEQFDVLREKMHSPLFNFLYKYCKNKDVILEIMDEVFCIIIKKAPKANYENCFSWICTIAKNQLMNYIKEAQHVIYTDKIEFYADNYNEEKKERLEFLKQYIKELDIRSKHLLYLIYFRQLKYKEICKELDISASTIKRNKTLILESLKGKILNEES